MKVLYGYRAGEVKLVDPGKMKHGTRISVPRPVDLSVRPPMYVNAGLTVAGVALPVPDPQDPITMAAGVQKRFASKSPEPDIAFLAEFAAFVYFFVREIFRKIPASADVTVDTFLREAAYTLARKEELMEKFTRWVDRKGRKYRFCKSFMKHETYPEYKHARPINSRTDEFKCLVGPIFRLIEKEVFSNSWFIKKVPIKDRPQFIRDTLFAVGGIYEETDFTSFEASFTDVIMTICEFQLYSYMVEDLPDRDWFMEEMYGTLAGENTCVFRDFVVKVKATRMSGEMNTSLGNGFTNFCMMHFMAYKLGSKVVGVVEGDDGLCRFIGPAPTAEMYAKLGFNVKLQSHTNLESASFCGLIFHPDDCVNVTDPVEFLASFGWVNGKYSGSKLSKIKTLLRCKALSAAHQYPGCPIISVMADKALELTASYDVRHMIEQSDAFSMWEREQLLLALKDVKKLAKRRIAIPYSTRLLMAEKFNIPVDVQVRIEEGIKGLKEDRTTGMFPELDDDFVMMLIPRVWRDNYNDYVVDRPLDLRRPPLHFLQDRHPLNMQPFAAVSDDPNGELTVRRFAVDNWHYAVVNQRRYLF